jgi:hypothetical protein
LCLRGIIFIPDGTQKNAGCVCYCFNLNLNTVIR